MICLVCGNSCDNSAPQEAWEGHFAPSPAGQGWVCLQCSNPIDLEQAWYLSLAEYREDVEEMGVDYA